MTAPRVKLVCPECGSADVIKDATVKWDEVAQAWTVAGVQDWEMCQACDAERDNLADRIPIK